MANALVEIEGPGGRAKVAEKDVKAYLRRDGYKLAGTPKPPKKLADADKPKESTKTEAPSKTKMKVKTDEKAAESLAEAAKEDADGFKELLATVEEATTPQLELIVDQYDLGLALSRIKIVADRRDAVTKALKAKMKKG